MTKQNLAAEEETLIEFGEGVHAYLSGQVWIADAKASFLIGFNFALATVYLNQLPDSLRAKFIFGLGAIALGVSLFTVIWVILPRMPHGQRGWVFWGDIRAWGSVQEYAAQVKKLLVVDIIEEYSHQNYYISNIVHKKYYFIRISILASLFAGICLIIFLLV